MNNNDIISGGPPINNNFSTGISPIEKYLSDTFQLTPEKKKEAFEAFSAVTGFNTTNTTNNTAFYIFIPIMVLLVILIWIAAIFGWFNWVIAIYLSIFVIMILYGAIALYRMNIDNNNTDTQQSLEESISLLPQGIMAAINVIVKE